MLDFQYQIGGGRWGGANAPCELPPPWLRARNLVLSAG